MHLVFSYSLAVVLYDGQRTEHATTDSYFELLYWRMRKLFKVSAVALFFTVLQVRYQFRVHRCVDWRGDHTQQTGSKPLRLHMLRVVIRRSGL